MRLAFVLALGCMACGGESGIYRGQVHSTSAGYAAVNAAAAGVLYVTAGGCKIAGCPTNTQCNTVTERCDPVHCGQNDCKVDEQCDATSGRCLPLVITAGTP